VNPVNFFAELKRRNVYKVAVAYLVASWLLIQIATQVFPFFEIPNWAVRLVVLILILGFPAALIFSWAFEITPEGIKRESEIGPGKSFTRKTGRKLVGLTVVLAVIAASLLVFQSVRPKEEPEKSVATQPLKEAKAPISPKSVAVLAFDNLSDDKESEYFSDGISEELLTVLQKIPGVRVAARTSSFSFKGKNATAQEIGQKLGVAHLVEGSVRKAGETVRIAARLTKTTSGDEIWSENYTRNLKDVFAVQTELAETIVGQLRGQLTDGDAKAKAAIQAQVQMAEKGGTKNVDAHQSYLQGRFYGNRNSENSVSEALVAYQRAVEVDPKFALAWAGLAEAHVWECMYSGELNRTDFDKHLANARNAADRALALEPTLPEALRVRAEIQLSFDFNWKGAAETLRTALTLAPTNVALLVSAGNLALAQGDPELATISYRQAATLDPVNPAARLNLAFNLAATQHFAEARAEFPRVVELNPAAPWAHAGLGLAYLLDGKFEEAVTEAQQDAAEWARLVVVAPARWSQKRTAESDAALARLKERFADSTAYQIAEVHAYRGEKDQAFEWLERARQQRDPGLLRAESDLLLVNLREDPRWRPFLRTMGMADNQSK
jgi:serine/threonine-protein kinase